MHIDVLPSRTSMHRTGTRCPQRPKAVESLGTGVTDSGELSCGYGKLNPDRSALSHSCRSTKTPFHGHTKELITGDSEGHVGWMVEER